MKMQKHSIYFDCGFHYTVHLFNLQLHPSYYPSRKLIPRPERVEQPTRAGVVAVVLAILLQLRLDLLGQLLTQLDTPLVKAVDVPNSALCECHVLVVRDQRT